MTNIKIIEKIGNTKGKTIAILAGIHGNEICGIKAFNEIIPKLKIENGKVYFIYANLKAIKQNKRFVEQNLNRCFFKKQPKKIKDSLEGRTAKEIIPFLEKADFMLDIHASNTPKSMPFLICGKQSIKFAKNLPGKIISYNWDKFEPGSTDYFMNLQKKIGICIECGYLKDPKTKETSKQAIMNFLIKCRATNSKSYIVKNKKFIKIIKLYENKFGKFKKVRDFSDFGKIKKKTLVGYDGNKKIYAKKGEILLFVRDREKIGEECFLTAREIVKYPYSSIKSKRNK